MSSVESSSYDADELGQYRSLSTAAVISFVLGLCSIVAFASPLLVVVPLAAVAMAILALRGIARSEGGLTGSRLAACGLALALMFAVGSFARIKIRDVLLERQADQVARQWLSYAMDGKSEQMLDWMSKAALKKLTPAVGPGEPMSYFGGTLAAALMRSDPYVVSLQELQAQGAPKLRLQDVGIVTDRKPAQAIFRYTVTGADAQQASYIVRLKRYSMSADKMIWFVDTWDLHTP